MKDIIEIIAEQAHEANRIYCESIGDKSHCRWNDTPQPFKNSYIEGAHRIIRYGATAEELHADWMRQKVSQGWAYGPNKDPEAKTHPSMVPYWDLPAADRVKDHIFRAVVISRALQEGIYEDQADSPPVRAAKSPAA